ncbi:uncharacterized protein LOC111702310 [Eurytemora carolleeae]|uniref:uncharacterized protein LOC111702310 n=1 Tax=Eurytemora carolleeae TaxID=1294199 RepID=UPI000C770CB1|nr:uncharacterized protein LOC111702310 [Eurytemora carolleeae]|eukprot:XP_023329722.1 uncharacterized protein LOC111702310 [Eurytemora affinis]
MSETSYRVNREIRIKQIESRLTALEEGWIELILECAGGELNPTQLINKRRIDRNTVYNKDIEENRLRERLRVSTSPIAEKRRELLDIYLTQVLDHIRRQN